MTHLLLILMVLLTGCNDPAYDNVQYKATCYANDGSILWERTGSSERGRVPRFRADPVIHFRGGESAACANGIVKVTEQSR